MALTKTQVSELYVAIFGRASEREGNKYWQTINGDISFIANNMLNTDAAKEYFGATLNDNKSFIEFIYKNTLNKTYAQDSKGIDYWTNQLNSGVSKGDVVSSMIYSINSYAPGKENYDANDLVTQKAYNQFINRVEVSDFTADMLLKAPYDYAVSTSFNKDLVVTDIKNSIEDAKIDINNLSKLEISNLKPQDISTIKIDVPIYVESKFIIDYGSNGIIDDIVTYNYSYENGVLNKFKTDRFFSNRLDSQYIYDSNGNNIEIRYATTYTGELAITDSIRYSYDSKGIITSLESFSEFKNYYSSSTVTWNSNGFIINGNMNIDGRSTVIKEIGTGLNSLKNAPLKLDSYLFDNLNTTYFFEYDSNGNGIKTLHDYDANGTIDDTWYNEWVLIG